MLNSPGVELTGITTCTEADAKRAGIVRYVLQLAGREEIPVAAGAVGSLGGFRSAISPALADEEAMWPGPIAPAPAPPGAALDLLERSIAAGATVLGIGPYTNLAMLETARPGLLASVPVVLMGGWMTAPTPGLPPWGPEIDYNVQQDVDAARIVIERCRPTLVQFPVTQKAHLREADLPRLERSGPLGRIMARQGRAHAAKWQMQKLGAKFPALPDDLLNFHYDPLSAAVALGWDGARVESMRLACEMRDGWLAMRPDAAGAEMRIVTDVDGSRFNRHWLDVVAPP